MYRDARAFFTAAAALSLVLIGASLTACGSDSGNGGDAGAGADGSTPQTDGSVPGGDGGPPDLGPPIGSERPDFNGDGEIHILVLGSSVAVRGGRDEFAPDQVASELESILMGDPNLQMPVSVVAEDIYRTFDHNLGQFTAVERLNSMLQYFYWPDGEQARHENLAGQGSVDWDHVIIASDPRIVARTPGFFAVGVNTVAEQVRAGGAEPRLLMVWPSGGDDAPLGQLEEFTYRAADGAAQRMRVAPAGLAWDALSASDQDTASVHPTPNGAYLAAATVYAQLFERSASVSSHSVNDTIADVALTAVENAATAAHYSGPRTHASAFAPGTVAAREILFHMTGTSSERGIRGGFRRAAVNTTATQVANDAPFAHFNYGRANQWFEDEKEYTYDPSRFDYSVGFPMHTRRDIDGVANAGDEAMRYGLDARVAHDPTSTDLGIALYMDDADELPNGRAIPIRALFAQARDQYGRVNPAESPFPGFRDNTHMSDDLDTASGSFLYTLLTGHCSLADEPADTTSGAWRQWLAHRVGYEMAWTMMHFRRVAPGFRVMPESAASVSVTPTEDATVSISFVNPPTEDVVVRIGTDNDAVVMVSPTELTFTPGNHATPQVVTMSGLPGSAGQDTFVLSSSTSSADPNFDGFVDRWEYAAIRP